MTALEFKIGSSYLLGKLLGSLVYILQMDKTAEYKIKEIILLEREISQDLEKYFYINE